MTRALLALLTIIALTGAAPALAAAKFPDVLIGRWLPATECGREEEHSVKISSTRITFYEETFELNQIKKDGPETYVFSGRWNVHGEISSTKLSVRLSSDKTKLSIDGYERAKDLVRCPTNKTASLGADLLLSLSNNKDLWMRSDA